MTKTSRSLTDLPVEVQTLVASELTYSDYYTCALVCRIWSQIFLPRIWRNIKSRLYIHFKPGDYSFHYRFSHSACNASALLKNGHLIHSFKFDFDHMYMRVIIDHSPAAFPMLTSIELQDIRDDDLLAEILSRATGGLRRLILHDFERRLLVGPKSAEALVRFHAPTLETLVVRSIRQFPSKYIQQLLMNAPRLRNLYLLPYAQTYNGHDEGFLDANDISEEEEEGKQGWACTSLETFACQIGGIPRPDIIPDPDISDIMSLLGPSKRILRGTRDQSLALQRRVYTQLGRLTNLKRLLLNIPHDPRLGYTQKDCLSMTLKSGLDLLGEMKQLKDLGVGGMEVGIYEKEEKEWVTDHWPHVVLKQK